MTATDAALPSSHLTFPLSEIDRGIADAIPKMSGPPQWPAFNAVRHLNRGWKIRKDDPNISVFRSIIAEEEAATAIFQSLRRRNYIGADKLRLRNHLQKNAVVPFFDAISRALAKVGDRGPRTEMILRNDLSPPRMELRAILPHPISGELSHMYPIPPLNFSVSGGLVGAARQQLDFREQMEEVVSESSARSIRDYLRERANLRNRVLYASSDGIPTVEGDLDQGLAIHQRNVFMMLKLYFLIDPYAEHQEFVQQSLDGFLKVTGYLKATQKETWKEQTAQKKLAAHEPTLTSRLITVRSPIRARI